MPSAPQTFAPIDFKTRFPALDGIRALAVTLVFADHFGGGYHGGTIVQLINSLRLRGWIGVDIFFVLSGFLITGILYDTRADSHYFKRFFARRSLRIFPVVYVVVIVLLLLTPVFHYQWHWQHLTLLLYIGNFFGNYNWIPYNLASATHPAASVEFSHFWSLCVEEQFYLLWPVAIWLIRDRVRLIWTAIGFSVIALALRIAMLAYFSTEVADRWIVRTLPFRMDALLIGGILALLLRGPSADRWQRRFQSAFLPAVAALLVIFCIPDIHLYWLDSIGLTLIALAGAGLISSTLRHGTLAGRLFSRRPLRTIGKYSYGFYIFHLLFRPALVQIFIFTRHWIHSLALNGILYMPCTYLLILFVSKLSYDHIEVRFLKLKTHFEYDTELTGHKHAFTTK